jgi:hypothetical protein
MYIRAVLQVGVAAAVVGFVAQDKYCHSQPQASHPYGLMLRAIQLYGIYSCTVALFTRQRGLVVLSVCRLMHAVRYLDHDSRHEENDNMLASQLHT